MGTVYLVSCTTTPGFLDNYVNIDRIRLGGPNLTLTTADLFNNPSLAPSAVFCFQRSSYVADFNLGNNNLLRAMLTAPETALVAMDKLSGMLQIEGMAMGDTIGACWQRNANEPLANNPSSDLTRDVCLLGDPTLGLHVTKPPTGVGIVTSPLPLRLTWTASEPNVTYNVYRFSSLAGTFTKQNSEPITGTSFPIASSSDVFMVRAVKLITSGSGSYYNLSQGAFYP